MIRKTTRNVWIQAVSGIRIVTCCLTFSALLLGSSHDVLAQENKDKVPPGKPFQALQRQIDELRAQQGNGEFEQLRVFNPDPTQASTLFWGPTDDCSIGIDPPGGLTGLIERDPNGFRLLGRDDQGCRLLFGPTDLCTVEVNPAGPDGLLLRDPRGIRILNPQGQGNPTLSFGAGDECRIRTGNIGLGDDGQLLFGLILEDPGAVAIRSPVADGRSTLVLGDDVRCQISVLPGDGFGMIFTDPERFLFDNALTIEGENNTTVIEGNLEVGGTINGGIISSRRWKENIRTIDDALDKVTSLRGVYFDWKEDRGGKPDVGFVAEEVAEVLPELTTFEKDGTTAKGVKYANLVAVAVEGIKAQQKQIEELQTENDALRKDFASLQSQMDDLSAKMGQLLSVGAE